ncbi:MAG: P-loop NTPase [Pseudomonadota bacterium]
MGRPPKKPPSKGAKCKWLITIHSQKGGVGKTLIALYLARRMAEKDPKGLNRRTVLIDADLTGTSLAHAIVLRAPAPWTNEETLPGFLSSEETHKGLKEWSGNPGEIGGTRDSGLSSPSVTVINDYLFCNPLVFRDLFESELKDRVALWHARDLLWCWEPMKRKTGAADPPVDLANLRIIPSSGFHSHVSQCLPHIYREDLIGYLDHRMTELVWQLWNPQWGAEPFDAVIIDCPPTLSGISRVALNLHGSLESRMENAERNVRPPIVHLALFISSADVQDVVGLWHGLDSLLYEKSGTVFGPSQEENEKKNISVMLDEVRIVVNKVPDTSVSRDPPPAELKTEGIVPGDSAAPAADTFSLGDSPSALEYFRHCTESFLLFQSDDMRNSDTLDKLLKLNERTFIIPYDKKCAEQFVLRRATFGIINQLEPLFMTVKEAAPRAGK